MVFSQRVFLNFSFLRKEKKSLFRSVVALQGSVKALYIALQPALDDVQWARGGRFASECGGASRGPLLCCSTREDGSHVPPLLCSLEQNPAPCRLSFLPSYRVRFSCGCPYIFVVLGKLWIPVPRWIWWVCHQLLCVYLSPAMARETMF